MEVLNICIDVLGVLVLLTGITVGIKRLYEFLIKGRKEKKANKQKLERARFVKDVRAEVKRYLEELAK